AAIRKAIVRARRLSVQIVALGRCGFDLKRDDVAVEESSLGRLALHYRAAKVGKQHQGAVVDAAID
ncbi:hypothetical protein, partial [Reyranella soli]|uniref:hypothetical protein n=1 Tax=Reyranella soli TaxID=1230389 RepID=UPI001C3FBD02